MNRRIGAIAAAAVIVIFAGFIIYDIIGGSLFSDKPVTVTVPAEEYPEPAWQTTGSIAFSEGGLKAIATTDDGRIIAGGKTFLALLDPSYSREWTVATDAPVTALAVYGNTIYAASDSIVRIYSLNGTLISEWGPYEDNSIITSISANNTYVVFADAGTRRVYILALDGSLTSFFGHEGEKFVIPSGYFDVKIMANNTINVANPGKTRIETRDLQGKIITLFGEPGTAGEAFVPCCNPSHFTMFGDSLFVTSEKGIHRMKVYTANGTLKEFVAVPGQFESALPFDLATGPRGQIYAASGYDSKIFIFTRTE
jgi:hypothetical protein